MTLLLTCLFFITAKCDEGDDDDFWNNLEDNDDGNVEVVDKVEGKTYDKARFNLPVARRLNSLFPDVARVVRDLQDVCQIEFIYEEKFPMLYFLDSQDVIVEKLEIGKKSKDEIKSLLTIRGFDLNMKKPKVPKPGTENKSTENEKTADADESARMAAL